MRILHIAEAFGGGLMEMVRTLAEGTADAGHQVAIAYGVRPETPTPEELRAEFDPAVELFPTGWTARTPAAQLSAARELRSLVSSWNPDLVHLHSSFAGVVGSVAVGSRAPTILSPHAYASVLPELGPVRRVAVRVAERFASRRVSVVGAVSHSEARFARERIGARRVEVVENGIRELDEDRMRQRALPEQPRILAMGRTVPQRRPVACARILSALADEADVAWVGGGGGERGIEGHEALTAAGITPSGWMPRERVLDELGAATAYLHWTSWDGQPLSVLEAMALDVVVVASDIEPNREVLGDAQVCREEADAVELLRRIVRDRDFAGALLENQRDRRGRYGARRMVEQWLSLYARELESRGARIGAGA